MDIQNELNSVFQEVFNNPNIQIHNWTTSNDIIGWDSFSHINLISAIEIHFGIEFSRREALSFNTVGDLIETIEKKCSQKRNC